MRGVGTSSECLGCEVGAGGDLDLGFSGERVRRRRWGECLSGQC